MGSSLCDQDRIEGHEKRPFLVTLARRVPEHQHEYSSVRMKFPTRRGLGSGQRIGWSNVIPLYDEPRT